MEGTGKEMFSQKMRKQTKVIVYIVAFAMVAGVLYSAGVALFGGGADQVALAAVATVNGQKITNYELQQVFISQLQQILQQQGQIPGQYYEVVKYQALDALIGQALISQEIKNRKITVPQKDINEEFQEIVNLFPSEEDFKQQLTYLGWTEQALKNALAEELKFARLQEEIAGDITVPEEDIIKAYEEVQASHILIRPEGTDEEAWLAAEERAKELRAELTVENFAEMAQIYSADGSASRGGDLGFFKRGVMVPEFEEAAFALGVNEISEPVRSQFGYHIIMVTDRKDAVGEEFEAARADIEAQLKEQVSQERFVAWFEETREAAEVEVIDTQLRAFQHRLNGEYEEAVRYYKEALEENPDDGYLYASLGSVYRELDNIDEAIANYEKAVEKVTADSALHMDLGNLYREAERIDEAVQAYLRASELAPNDMLTQFVLHNFLTGMERHDEAAIIEQRIEEYQERLAEAQQQQEEAQAELDETPAELEETDVEADAEESVE